MALYFKSLGLEGIERLGLRDIFLEEECLGNEKRIGVLNLMPLKGETEEHILNMLSKCDEDLIVEFLKVESHKSKHTSEDYLERNYSTFNQVKENLDGIIITGAPVEKLEFNEVYYMNELREIIDYFKFENKPAFYICWGGQVALNHLYGVRKKVLDKKIFGVFSHEILKSDEILRGINSGFKAPHSRYSTILHEDVDKIKSLKVLAQNELGEYVVLKGSFNDFYVLGHLEYSKEILKNEYLRDREKGEEIDIPRSYFLGNEPSGEILFSWKESGENIYRNWVKGINKRV